MAKRRGLKGEGIVGTHTTIIEVAKDVLRFVAGLDDVKISPGIITQVNRKASRAIKFTPTKTGLLMKVLGKRSVQSFYIYTHDPQKVIDMVNREFPNDV